MKEHWKCTPWLPQSEGCDLDTKKFIKREINNSNNIASLNQNLLLPNGSFRQHPVNEEQRRESSGIGPRIASRRRTSNFVVRFSTEIQNDSKHSGFNPQDQLTVDKYALIASLPCGSSPLDSCSIKQL